MEIFDTEIMLALMKKGGGGGGGGGTLPVLNAESVYSENDVNQISKTFTASDTSAYMLIMSICNGDYSIELTKCEARINGGTLATLHDYYTNAEKGIISKCAFLNLNEGDTISAELTASVDTYGTSASIALVRLSNGISDLKLKASDVAVNYTDASVDYTVENDGFYLLFFFIRQNDVGSFKTLKLNNENILQNIIICSYETGWQISHGMCMIEAKQLDNIKVSAEFNGYFASCGVMGFKSV